MTQSMTGYGKHTVSLPNKTITVELKSLNSKQTDINARIPHIYKAFEIPFRKQIADALFRGKIDLLISVVYTEEKPPVKINEPLVKAYVAQLKKIDKETRTWRDNKGGGYSHFEYIKTAMRMPDVFEKTPEEVDENEATALKNALESAINELQKFRIQEGKSIQKDFSERILTLESLLGSVVKIDPERIIHVKEKMNAAFEEMSVEVDKNRLEQELIFYMEKLDINEEISRLKNHLAYFKQTLTKENQAGKKLGFIAQEIGREINTIGSKANFAALQKIVVLMKNELEKIKEQLLNTL